MVNLSADVSLTETVEGGFLLNKRTGDCFALNRVGLAVWKSVRVGTSPEDIVESLARDFRRVPRATISSDVRTFLEGLAARKLLQA